MSKKDYEAIAKIIKYNADSRYDIAVQLAVYFEKDNPKFDRLRFLKACGVI